MASGVQAAIGPFVPVFLAFSWVSILFAHGWNRVRHGGGGLLWVIGILWSSTWLLLGNSAIYWVKRSVGGVWEFQGVNLRPPIQIGIVVTYLVLLAMDASRGSGWTRLDLGRAIGIRFSRGRHTRYALGHLLLMSAGVTLAAGIAFLVGKLT